MNFRLNARKGSSQDVSLASELLKLEGGARRSRARAGEQYSRSLLAGASGVAEAKFVGWLTGTAVADIDDGELTAVVSELALWAGQPMPDVHYWRSLATATRKRPAGVWRRIKGLLRKPSAWLAGIAASVITAFAVAHLTSSPGPQTVPGSPPPPAGSTLPATASNSPARVVGVTPLSTGAADVRAAGNPVRLTAQQLARFNADYQSGGIGSAATAGFLSSIHAVPAGDAFTNVTVIGNEKANVTITGMQVVKDCQAQLSGTLFFSPGQGVITNIGLGFNLDSTIDYAQNRSPSGDSGDYFKRGGVTLAPGEMETFNINVGTSLHFCKFTFQMTVTTYNGGLPITEDISNYGKPFELTGMQVSPNLGAPYSQYSVMYYGGAVAAGTAALHDPSGGFVEVNPKTFNGS